MFQLIIDSWIYIYHIFNCFLLIAHFFISIFVFCSFFAFSLPEPQCFPLGLPACFHWPKETHGQEFKISLISIHEGKIEGNDNKISPKILSRNILLWARQITA